MSALKTYLGAELGGVTDEVLILLRLLGRAFARPINSQSGDAPEDVLEAYLVAAGESDASASEASAPFVALIETLLDGRAPGEPSESEPMTSLVGGLDEASRASLAFRLVRLLDTSPSIKVDSDALRRLIGKYAPNPHLSGPSLSAFWHLLLSRFANEIIPDDEIAVCRNSILNPAFVNGPIIATARSRPFLFFDAVLPIIFRAMREGAREAKSWPALNAAFLAGFESLYADPVNSVQRKSQLNLLAGQLEELVASKAHSGDPEADVAEALLDSAAQATAWHRLNGMPPQADAMPFADFAVLEAGLSRGKARAANEALGDRIQLVGNIEKFVEPIRSKIKKMGSGVDLSLVTNFHPYAEGVLLKIWQELMDRAGLVIEMKFHDRDMIVSRMFDGKISFAIWNDYIDESYKMEGKTVECTDHPLLRYDKWPLVMRRNVLETIAASNLRKEEAKLLVSTLVEGVPIPYRDFMSCNQIKNALIHMSIELVEDTEMQDVANKAFGVGQLNSSGNSSDISVEKLIDGEIDGAFLGGVQAEYVTRRFGHALVTLVEVERSTPMHLWFDGKPFDDRNYRPTIKPLLVGWAETCKLWEDAKKSAEGSDLRNWILTLASQLNFGVLGAAEGIRTPISSWRELSDIVMKHDSFQRPTKVGLFKPEHDAIDRSVVRLVAVADAA